MPLYKTCLDNSSLTKEIQKGFFFCFYEKRQKVKIVCRVRFAESSEGGSVNAKL